MDKPWKKFEREASALISGRRFWANSGEALDCEGPTAVAQCKYVQRMSLPELEDLAVTVEKQALPKFKAGLVIVKRSGKNGPRKARTLVVMTAETWRQLHGPVVPPFDGGDPEIPVSRRAVGVAPPVENTDARSQTRGA